MIDTLLELLWSCMKIGLLAFGGGNAAIPLLEAAAVPRWMSQQEFGELVSINFAFPGISILKLAGMVGLRAAKVAGIADDIPPVEVDHQPGARLLVLGWGSTYGPIGAAVRRVRGQGGKVAQAHLRHLNPFPANLGEVLAAYEQVLVPEMNLGQLLWVLRAKFLVDAQGFNKIAGKPFLVHEIVDEIKKLLEGKNFQAQG